MLFIKNNWRGFLFPFFCGCIILVDQVILEIPLGLTIVKISCFSIIHYIYVLKSQYIYKSDIYNYMTNLKIELSKNNVIKPLLSKNTSTYLFWSYFLLVTLFISNFSILIGYKKFIFSLIIILTVIVFIDSLNELLRLLLNKSDLSRVYVPHSLQQTRYFWEVLAKLTPVCTSFSKVTLSFLIGSEVVYPSIFGDGQELGPITKIIGNKYIHPDCNIPIETRFDMQYESYKTRWNLDVDQELRPIDSRMPERITNICCKDDMYDLNSTTSMIEAMTSGSDISLSTKK